jgi:hypothetical protein
MLHYHYYAVKHAFSTLFDCEIAFRFPPHELILEYYSSKSFEIKLYLSTESGSYSIIGAAFIDLFDVLSRRNFRRKEFEIRESGIVDVIPSDSPEVFQAAVNLEIAWFKDTNLLQKLQESSGRKNCRSLKDLPPENGFKKAITEGDSRSMSQSSFLQLNLCRIAWQESGMNSGELLISISVTHEEADTVVRPIKICMGSVPFTAYF